MKLNKKVIESAAVAVFALVITVTAIAGGNGYTKAEQYTKEDRTEEVQVATKERIALDVVAASAQAYGGAAANEIRSGRAAAGVSAAIAGNSQVLAAAQDTEALQEAAVEEVSPWANRLMPNVNGALNIRSGAGVETDLVGKLYKGAAADILERGEEWTKISSGSVEGYVKNEYCVFGAEAEAMANEQGTVYATALVGGLRVRAQASADDATEVVSALKEGEKLKVDTGAEAPEGWVAVLYAGRTAYVSGQHVTVELEVGKAISIEEEIAAIRKAEEEKAAKAAKKAAASKKTQKPAVAASYDDVTLLGALIQCEAGGESYEGKVAVGAVVMNRLRRGYAGSISGVIYQSGQFTPASSGALASRLNKGVSSSCMQAAQEAINGVDNVNGALHFHRVGRGQDGIIIGNHVFF